MIYIVAEDSIDWASIATECQNSRIVDAEGNEVKWSLAYKAAYPLKIYPQKKDKFGIRKNNQEAWLGTKIKFDAILSVVSEQSGIRASIITGTARGQIIAQKRFLVCWLAYNYFGYSSTEIGKMVSGRNHTTVLHSIQRFDRTLEYDKEMIALKDKCVNALNSKIINTQINLHNGWSMGDQKPDVNVIVNAAFQEEPLGQITLSKAAFDGTNWIDRHGNAIEGRFWGWKA